MRPARRPPNLQHYGSRQTIAAIKKRHETFSGKITKKASEMHGWQLALLLSTRDIHTASMSKAPPEG
jgi:hypothetical protein